MKKLLLSSLLLVAAIPAIALQNVPTTHTPGLYIHPFVAKFTGNDAPTGSAVMHIVHDDKPQIEDYSGLPNFITLANAQALDSHGRNLAWWAALMGKKNLYNKLVELGVDTNVKSTSGLLAGFSAAQLNQMSPDDIESLIEAGFDAVKAKL